jgi:quercetin dioxygenase-like cupin family protein
MEITRSSETSRGPDAWFTGEVFIDTAAVAAKGSRISASVVHFTPGARTAWHRHPHGQSLWILEGAGLVQRRGGPVEPIRAGDRVFIEPGEEHWHGASPTRFMSHVAMLEVGEDGSSATWGDHVTDEEYRAGS